MKALVTGGTGFIGKYLVEELLSRGLSTRLLVRSKSSNLNFYSLKNIELWFGDLTQPQTLCGISEGIDYVYHLAAEGHVSALSSSAYQKFFKVNVEGTRNLIMECGKNPSKIKKFIHFSSTAAMGLIKKKIVDESDVPQPVTPYQKSKLESERVALDLGKQLGLPVVILRPCMVYGVNGKGEFFRICQWMRKGIFPRVGFGKNLTPLVHVKDVVRGAILASQRGIPGEIYLITSERSIDLNELRRLVMRAWGKWSPYPYVPVWFMYGLAWCFEIISMITGNSPLFTRKNIASTVWDREFSIEKAKKDLGYYSQISFEEGISETVNWFKTLI